jgi:hypothetical protein
MSPDGVNKGLASFKGLPAEDAVEIAYAVLPEHGQVWRLGKWRECAPI